MSDIVTLRGNNTFIKSEVQQHSRIQMLAKRLYLTSCDVVILTLWSNVQVKSGTACFCTPAHTPKGLRRFSQKNENLLVFMLGIFEDKKGGEEGKGRKRREKKGKGNSCLF